MESNVIFRDGMDNDPADYNKLQDFVRGSLDHIVGDAVTEARKFAGFTTEITGAATVAVAPGRLFSAGQVFVRTTELTKSFLTQLPVATKKIVLLVGYGQEVETDERPREFLINEETGASEPQTVAMESARICVLNFASGQEGADPIDPIVDAGTLPIARIVLTPSGIATVTMLADNRLDSVASVADRVDILEQFQARTEPQVVALGSDIATLKKGIGGNIGKELFGRTLARLAAIEEKVGIPSAALDSDCDFFLDLDETDAAFAGYDAKVAEGIRFAPAASATSALAIFNTQNPAAKIVSGTMFPAYALEDRLSVGPRQGDVQVSAFTYQANEIVELTMSRTRIRYGQEQTVCTNSAWWQTGQYDAARGVFAKDGETFAAAVQAEFGDVPGHNLMRVQTYWEDTYEEPYWAQVTVDHTVNGSQVAETFLNANDGWLAAVSLTFTQLANAGGVTLGICETERGMPDLKRFISYTTVDRADLKVNDVTRIPILPVFLQGGRRYALVVITAANHWLATTQGTNFPQGTFFYVLDGAYQQGDGTRDLCFTLHMAKFTQSRAVIELTGLQLAGGIAAIDILADSVVPGSTDLTYEIQVGSVWYPLAAVSASVLATLPALVPIRAVFTGTPDVMPALRLTGSRVIVSRPKTALTHVSKIRTLPGSGSSSVRLIARLEHFEPAHHTAVAKIRTGAGYATVVAASSFVDAIAEDGSIERTWLFNLGAPVTSFRKQFEATTDSLHRAFHFGWAKDFAL